MFCLCGRVDDVLFEGNQDQPFEEEQQQFGKEGKWTSPPAFSIFPNNSMTIHFIVELHKCDGTPNKDLPSLLPQNLEHRV